MKRLSAFITALVLVGMASSAHAATLLGGEQINRTWQLSNNVGLKIIGGATPYSLFTGTNNSSVPTIRLLSNGDAGFSGALVVGGATLFKSSVSVNGALSGSTFYGAGLGSCSGSNQKLLFSITTGLFSCGNDQNTVAWSNTGALQTAFDTRFVNTSGDTMTGALSVRATLSGSRLVISGNANVTGALLVVQGITTRGTVSGATLAIQSSGTVSGALLVKNTLATKGTLSGSFLTIQRSATISGSLIVKTSIVAKTSVSGSTLNGFGLGSCSNASTSKVLYNNTTNQFTCGTDTDTNTSYTAGANLTLAGTSFKLNATVTGTNITAGTTLSGLSLVVSRSATVSGALLVKSSVTSKGSLSGATIAGFNLGSCNGTSQKLLYNYSTQKFECGSDQTGSSNSFGTGNVLTIADARYLKRAGGTMTGQLVINLTSGFYGLKIINTSSGNIIHAEKDLTSSGTITAVGQITAKAMLSGTSLTISRAATISGALLVKGTLAAKGTISGSILTIQSSATISGSLLVKGNIYSKSTMSGVTVYGKRCPQPMVFEASASGSALTTGSGKVTIPIPRYLSGYSLAYFNATVDQAGTTGLTRIALRDTSKGKRQIFSTVPSIDSTETSTSTAATPYVINTANDDVGGGDNLSLDILQIQTTAPKGLDIELEFSCP